MRTFSFVANLFADNSHRAFEQCLSFSTFQFIFVPEVLASRKGCLPKLSTNEPTICIANCPYWTATIWRVSLHYSPWTAYMLLVQLLTQRFSNNMEFIEMCFMFWRIAALPVLLTAPISPRWLTVDFIDSVHRFSNYFKLGFSLWPKILRLWTLPQKYFDLWFWADFSSEVQACFLTFLSSQCENIKIPFRNPLSIRPHFREMVLILYVQLYTLADGATNLASSCFNFF